MHHRTATILILVLITSAAASVFLIQDIAGTELSVVITDSMDGDPTGYSIQSIPRGSLIAVSTSVSELQIGDVVGYHTPVIDGVVYHRVVSIDQDTITVKGDNLDLEETIRMQDVEGKVLFVNEPLGHIVSFVKDNQILIILIVLGAYLLFNEVPSSNRGQESEEK